MDTNIYRQYNIFWDKKTPLRNGGYFFEDCKSKLSGNNKLTGKHFSTIPGFEEINTLLQSWNINLMEAYFPVEMIDGPSFIIH